MGRAKSELEVGLTVAGKADIPGMRIVWQDKPGAYADIERKSIYLPRMATCTGTPVEVVALVRALFHHEKGHIRRSTIPKRPGSLGLIQNVVEDVWMEWAEANESGAGLRGIFDDKARYYAKKIAKDQSKPETSGPVLWEALAMMMGQARGVSGKWKLSEKAQKYFDVANTVFQEGVVLCNDSNDCLALAKEIYELLKESLKQDKPEKQDSQEKQESDEDGESEDGDSGGSCDDEDGDDDDEGDESGNSGGETEDEDDDEDDSGASGGSEGEETDGDTDEETDDDDSDETDEDDDSDDESGSGSGSKGDDDETDADDDEDDGTDGAGDDTDDETDADDGKSAGGTAGDDETDDDDDGKLETGDKIENEPDPDLTAPDGDASDAGDDKTDGSGEPGGDDDTGSVEPTDQDVEDELEADAFGEAKDYTDYVNEDLEALLQLLEPGDLEYTSLKDNDVHKMVPDDARYRVAYNTLRKSVSKSARKIESALMMAVQALTTQYPIRGLRRGDLDSERLALLSSGLSTDVFSRIEQDDFSLEGTEIIFVVDNSSSMRGSIDEVKKWLTAVGDALDKLNVKFGIVGTTTGGNVPLNGFTRTKPIWFTHYKVLDEQWRLSAPRLVTMESQNNNVDGEAVEWASFALSQRPNKRRIVISVCDGLPCSAQGHSEGRSTEVAQAMADNITRVCEVWRGRGVEIYDVAIGTDAPAEFYGEDNHIRFDSGTDFSPAALRHFAKILIQGRMAIH